MSLEQRLEAHLNNVPHVSKRMFGGLCFMVRGNMTVGTFRNGMMVRVSKENHAATVKLPGASAMEMKGRVMEGFILIDAKAVESDAVLERWIGLALAYNATLPEKAAKPVRKIAKKK